MRICVICERQVMPPRTGKFCSEDCHQAYLFGVSREEYLERGEQLQKKRQEQRQQQLKEAKEAGYGNCVIFRDDGGYNRQYLTADGAWTVDRNEAARCLDADEADELARKHNVVFFGKGPRDPGCDILVFRFPDQYQKWLAANGSEIDAEDPQPTKRFALGSSADPHQKAKELMRWGLQQMNSPNRQ